LGALVVREQVDEFVPEDGYAAGLETYDWDSSFDLRFKLVQDLKQQALGTV